MKKTLLALLSVGIIAAVGCKKDDNNNTNPNTGPSLVGNWKMASYAIDTNGDMVMQNSEQRTPGADEYGYLFATNQMITDSSKIDGVGITLNYSYIRRNDSVFSNLLGETDLEFVIEKLDATTLNILKPYSTGTEWYFYTRQ